MNTNFEWDEGKNADNLQKHGVNFETAQYAFIDPRRVIAEDLVHSKGEKRYFVFGKVKGGVLTVRFTYRRRRSRIRIIGAGYWRKGKNIYKQSLKIKNL